MSVKMNGPVFVLLAVAAFCMGTVRSNNCLKGAHHLKTSQVGGENFTGVCLGFKSKTCCSDSTAQSLDVHHDRELHGIHYDDCGPLSASCNKYMKDEGCFYECSPYIKPWEYLASPIPGDLRNVPICGSYCDAWYNACKDDRICAPNIIELIFSLPIGSQYHCIGYKYKNQTCKTFAEWYGNGKKLCETFWGKIYTYAETDSNCFTFTSEEGKPNPGACVTPPGNSTPVDPADCSLYRQSLSSAERPSQAMQLVLLLSSVTLLAAWFGQN